MNAPLIREATLDVREDHHDRLNRSEMMFEAVQETSALWDEMFASTMHFDGSYEAARARFHVLFGEIGK